MKVFVTGATGAVGKPAVAALIKAGHDVHGVARRDASAELLRSLGIVQIAQLLNLPGTHTVSRCAQCGTLLTLISEPLGQCPKCGFELHSCKQCTYFDPSSRFECMQPVPERIAKKDARNECAFYSISVRVEKQTSTGATSRPDDARRAFDNLFKD